MINRIWKVRPLRVAGLALGAVAVAGAAIAVTASASGMTFGLRQGPAATTAAVDANPNSAVCSNFMKHFAVEIGKSQAEINAAFQKAVTDTLADEVKAGQITQAQSDAIKKKLANQTPCTLPSSESRRPGGDKAVLGAVMQQYLSAAASALGITQTQLQTDLKSGQSLSQIAAAQHVSEADFRTKLIANLKPALDTAVTDKKLSAAQEQSIINRLQTGTLPLWNTAAKPRPKQSPSPAASPSTA
jgi:hypothetical protein